MAINPIGRNYYFIKNNQINNNQPSFGAVKKINLQYIKDHRFHLLPERMQRAVLAELDKFQGNYRAEGIRSLLQLHKDTYAKLADAKTLKDVKKMFPEFKDLVDFAKVSDEFPCITKVLKAHNIQPEDFSLMFLKDLWLPTKLKDVCNKYGFTSPSALNEVMARIKMPRYDKNYTILMQTSEEAGNRAFAERTLLTDTPAIGREALKTARRMAQSPEARAKHDESLRKFYQDPLQRERIGAISKRQWALCPEIKEAMAAYLEEFPIAKAAFAKEGSGIELTKSDRSAIRAFYKSFWDAHPELKKLLGKARTKAANEVSKSWNA